MRYLEKDTITDEDNEAVKIQMQMHTTAKQRHLYRWRLYIDIVGALDIDIR